MNNQLGVKLHNKFEAVLIDSKTNKVKQTAIAENVVTNFCFSDTNNSYYTITYMVLGTGSGTPAATDTRLFNQLGYTNLRTANYTLSRVSENQWKTVFTKTYSESLAIGALTEIGFAKGDASGYYPTEWAYGTSYNEIYTHAMFTDAEGHPITINKTDTDRLTITATLYVTVTEGTHMNNVHAIVNLKNNYKVSCNQLDPYVAGDSYYNDFINYLSRRNSSLSSMFYYLPISAPLYSTQNVFPSSSGSTILNVSGTTRTYRTTNGRVLSTAGNCSDPNTYLIKCIGNTYAFATLPAANIYPARTLTLTAEADGNTQDFNFKIPILKTQGVKVYIDNTLQDPSTYTFNGRDYTHPQGWESCDILYVKRYEVSTNGSGSTSGYCYTPMGVQCHVHSTGSISDTYYYDFGQAYTVTHVGKYLNSGLRGYCSDSVYPHLYYSNDNTTWTELPISAWTNWSTYFNTPNISNIAQGWISVTSTSARYWKVECPPVGQSGNSVFYINSPFLFGSPKAQLHFNTAPRADATITIEADCEYPIKNTNWIIENGMAFDYVISPTS